jgi:hypothetical protein
MNKSDSKKSIALIAETNFVLDIAFEQSEECSRLLDFIRKNGVSLVIPEYALAEADGSILTKIENRLTAIDSALNALKQASRSIYSDLDDFINKLEKYKDGIEQKEYYSVLGKKRILDELSIRIPFTSESMVKSELRGLKKIAPFKQTDRIIYESILEFAKSNQNLNIQMLFFTRDKNDFDFPFIREELASLNIELFFSAGDCIKRIMELTDTNRRQN